MENLGVWLGLIGCLISLFVVFKYSPSLPKYDELSDIDGEQFFGLVQIDNDKQPVHFVVGKEKLGIKGGFPSFSLLLSINELELSKQKKLFGSQVRIISHDSYTEHLFDEIFVSNRVAKKLEKLSNGKLCLNNA